MDISDVLLNGVSRRQTEQNDSRLSVTGDTSMAYKVVYVKLSNSNDLLLLMESDGSSSRTIIVVIIIIIIIITIMYISALVMRQHIILPLICEEGLSFTISKYRKKEES